MKSERTFLLLWTLAVAAATAAFVLHLGLRVRSVELGYELGRSHARVQRLREVRHVLEVELGSQRTPERVDFVARTLLGMSEPTAERIRSAGPRPHVEEAELNPAVPAPTSPGVSASEPSTPVELGSTEEVPE
jgi:cell division protein FtsL